MNVGIGFYEKFREKLIPHFQEVLGEIFTEAKAPPEEWENLWFEIAFELRLTSCKQKVVTNPKPPRAAEPARLDHSSFDDGSIYK